MGKLVPLILAGGTGSRLWPISRQLYPKQFHAILGDATLLQATVARANAVAACDPIIICNDEHRFLVAEQLQGIGRGWLSLMLEPAGRNTAPAVALGAHRALAEDPEALLLFLPSDHLVRDEVGFAAAVADAAGAAAAGGFVTFGVRPAHAETGYGYIEVADPDAGVQPIVSFKEKPDNATAAAYVAAGNYLWNSGMFVLHAATYLEELARFQPAMAVAVQAAYAAGTDDLDFFRPGEAFLDSPADSIDYAVMERTTKASVVPVDIGWNDIGSWSAILEESALDGDGNHLSGDVVAVGTTDSLVRADTRLVGTLGVDRLVIVETADAVLVAARDQVQDVKHLVERLQADDREEQHTHSEVFRPWGSYETVGRGSSYQVKRIKVSPGARLSLQKHAHRSEHWVVVQGTAEVTCGEEVFELAENESTYIPLGAVHRLANPTDVPLEIVEVQVGSYLGEDDIVRLDDVYGRSN